MKKMIATSNDLSELRCKISRCSYA